jgi:hypothetical protein
MRALRALALSSVDLTTERGGPAPFDGVRHAASAAELDPGEREAIQLALEAHADLLLMDG